MSTAAPVPETALLPGHEFSADWALATLRRAGPLRLLRDAFIWFRYRDGFSHAWNRRWVTITLPPTSSHHRGPVSEAG